MSLFQKRIIENNLKKLPLQEIKEKYQKFVDYFHNSEIQKNIREAKEEQFQEGFLRELFVNILGYTINPDQNYNLTTEFKNLKDARKADGAIIDGEKVKAIIELKDTKTINLKNIENQAFGYKNNQKNCRYVITSNFEKLRFYIDNAIDFEEWNLFNLSEIDFKVLFLLLNKDHLLADLPADLKRDSLIEEENISKRFYQEYSTFRKELFQNLMLCNPEVEKLLLFKKTQKLLDRFLFLFFAKDKGLIAANSVLLVLNNWKVSKNDPFSVKRSLYDYFKSYFDYLNVGFKNEKLEIFAYNGGLFVPDEIIDNFKITDNVLEKACEILSKYNYDSEVDVNILGHIFEHSLKEIEELEAQFFDDKIKQNQKVTKRKKDGIFYTPRYITKYIVENTLGVLCSQEKQRRDLKEEDYFFRKNIKANKATIQTLLDNLHNYKDWLLNLSIVDPACGSGAFLNQALTFLINEHKWLNELEAKLMGSSLVFDLENSILENNLFGVDINEESVEISKLSLWLRTAKPHRKLTSLNDNIKCGNSLVDDPNVAGEKAFNWQQAFPHIFAKGGFDVIIGNPPYGAKLDEASQRFLLKKYELGSTETAILFLEKGFDLLKQHGKLSFIIPKSFLFASNYKKIRKFLFNNISAIVDCKKVWQEVLLEQTIILFDKTKVFQFYDTNILLDSTVKKLDVIDKQYVKQFGFFLNNVTNNEINIANKMLSNAIMLNDIATNHRGGMFQQYIKNQGDLLVLGGANIQRFGISDYKGMIDKNYVNQQSYILPNSLLVQRIIAHIENPIEHIKITACIPEFNKKMVIVDTINQITLQPEINQKYIWCILNSKLINWYAYSFIYGKAIRTMQFDNPVTQRIPVIKLSNYEQQPFIEKVDVMLMLNQKLLDLKTDFNEYLTVALKVSKLSKILQNPEKHSLEQLTAELKKQKVNADDFNIFKSIKELHSKFIEIKNKIEITDQQINQMVYELYELTPEEIAILESE